MINSCYDLLGKMNKLYNKLAQNMYILLEVHSLSSSETLYLIFLCCLISKVQAITLIGKEEGIRGYWKGNLPQVFSVSHPGFRFGYSLINFDKASLTNISLERLFKLLR